MTLISGKRAVLSANSANVFPKNLPWGALGVWAMDRTIASPSPAVPNLINPKGVSPSLIRAPRRLFSNTGLWNATGTTVSDSAATAPDGSNDASTINCTGNWTLGSKTGNNFPNGTYTLAAIIKSNTGSNQQFAFSGNNTGTRSSALTATTTWQRFSYTFTSSSNISSAVLCSIDGSTAANLQICDFNIYAGSTDLGPSGADGNLYLGLSAFDTLPVISTGTVGGSNGGYGFIQLPTAVTLSAFTVQQVIKKTASDGYGAALSKIQSYSQFTAYTAQTDKPSGAINNRYNTTVDSGNGAIGATGANMWGSTLTNNGFHLITHRFDGAKEELFLDDVRLFVDKETLSAPSIADLFWNLVNVNSLYGKETYHGIALWNRALSNTEVVQSFNVWKAHAAKSAITLNGDTTNRIYVAEGDSITGGFSYAYPTQASFSPVVFGSNFAVSGSGIANLVARAPYVDAIIPLLPNGRKFIMSVLIGANDLSTGYSGPGGTGISGWLADLSAYCDARRSAGWKVVVCTVTPRTASGFNAARDTANTTIRTWIGTHCDAIADFASDPSMGIDGDGSTTGPWNTTYYADGEHPTSAGMAVLAPYLASAVNGL